MRNVILCGDVRAKLRELADESVHCCVTSPPYWSLRDYGVEGQLGLEATPEEFVANMVTVFREVRRVLRSDGTCWINLGDSYAHPTSGGGGAVDVRTDGRKTTPGDQVRGRMGGANTLVAGLKPKDLVGIPWRVAFALQADGWWLRSDVIWSKPNPMPESVTDRPTKAHEYLFLLAKSAKYFYDADAIRETNTGLDGNARTFRGGGAYVHGRSFTNDSVIDRISHGNDGLLVGRNKRTVWEIATEPYAEAHFATYPTDLVKPCILAGTSEHGCCAECGAPWGRVVEMTEEYRAVLDSGRAWRDASGKPDEFTNRHPKDHPSSLPPKSRTTGWAATCKHHQPGAGIAPGIVLDPFLGSGTTALVAKLAGRDYLGIELNPSYVELAERRIHVDQERLL
jgi:DNA modification methylase